MTDPVVIVAARRTPIGAFQGQFAATTAPQLGVAAVKGVLADLGDQGAGIDEAVFGCCLMGGVKQAPARQVVLGAGLSDAVPATTLTKMCGSGMKATMLVHDMLLAGSCRMGLAGGIESMSNAPYLLSRAREGYRLGHGQVFDHMLLDGLEDAYEGKLMGYYADLSAREHGVSRERQDAFAAESVRRAQAAVASGAFRGEIAPVTVVGRKGETLIDADETPGKCDIAKIPLLKPAFIKDGSVTPANSSSISDGAAALVLMRESEALRRGLLPLARILSHATHAQKPGLFTTAPAPCHPGCPGQGRVDGGRCGPVRDQRGLRPGDPARHGRSGHLRGHRQRPRWSLRHGTPGGGDRRPHHRHPDPRPAPARPQARHRQPVHRRRRGHGHGRRSPVSGQGEPR